MKRATTMANTIDGVETGGGPRDCTNPNQRCSYSECKNPGVYRGFVRLPFHYCLACLVHAGVLNDDGSERRHARPIEPALNGDAAARKAAPMFEGLVAYFPNALAYVSHVSKKGNDQHNPGLPMQWSFDKSTDERDCLIRHLAEAGTLDTDGLRHSGKVAWRALANLERELLASDPTLKPGANVRGYK